MAITARDVDGKVLPGGASLDPETAANMARERWAKPKRESKGELLKQAGYDDPDKAPEHLRVLADIASSGRSGAVSAMGAFLRLTGREEGQGGGGVKVLPGEVCGTCGQVYLVGVPVEKLVTLLNLLASEREIEGEND